MYDTKAYKVNNVECFKIMYYLNVLNKHRMY